jgi:hypothetical protein
MAIPPATSQLCAAFVCIAELFDWLPRDLWNTRGQSLFNAALQVFRWETPPIAAFLCVAKCAEALFFLRTVVSSWMSGLSSQQTHCQGLAIRIEKWRMLQGRH